MSDVERGPDFAAGIDESALADGMPLRGTFRDEDVVMVRHAGRVCALAGRCTHLSAPLADGIVVDGELRCPWHHARFSLATGEAVAAPAFAPLARFDVDTRDGRIFVTGQASTAAAAGRAHDPIGRVVVVGGGAAGHACAEMLARHGLGASVTLVSDDADPPYDRTQCSKQYLIGLSTRADCDLADRGLTGVALRIGERVDAIDPAAKHVVMAGGEPIAYDTLVLATGAEPQRPHAPGFDRPNVHVLRTLADADRLIAASQGARQAVVIGASFIGLEAAASLTQRHVTIHVVAPDDIPLRKVLGPEVGAMIRAVHEEKGVVFHPGREARGYDGAVVTLDDGSTIAADFVVLGVGVKPRTALAEAAGLAVASADDGGGVIVDAQLRTSVPDVFAIGDIARYPDRYADAALRVEHWVHAQRQGQFVARWLMGDADRFADLPFFWTAHFDTGPLYLGHTGTIAEATVDGAIAERAFTMRQQGKHGDVSFVACDRDRDALRVEAAWERGEPPTTATG